MKILSFNARCLRNKFAQLALLLDQEDPDVVVITETWFDDSVKDSEYTPDGYLSFRKDRNLNAYSSGTYQIEDRGGVLMLVKECLHPTRIEQWEPEIEMLWVAINPQPKVTWVIGGCYRPEVDETNIMSKIVDSINKVNTTNCILLGDFNLRHVNWEELTSTRNVDLSFLDCIGDNLLTQIVREPTREGNILDLALVGDVDSVTSCKVLEHFANSDHNMVELTVDCPVPRITRQERKVYLYTKGNYDGIATELQQTNWEDYLKTKNMEAKWAAFKEEYNRLVEKHIPHKMVKQGDRNKKPWTRYNSVKKAKKKKRAAFVQHRKSGLHADKILYSQESMNQEEVLRKAKLHYENKLADNIQENPKLFWNYVRHYNRSSSTVDTLEEEGAKYTDDTQKATILNKYFASVLTKEPEIVLPLPRCDQDVNHILTDLEVTPDMVRRKLLKLKPNKASGPDDINVNVLRRCPDLDIPLTILFNCSIQTGHLPTDWRYANITPLFKKGSRLSKANYRPVSLTSQIVKVLERIVQDHVLGTVQRNNLISCEQHGFQPNCSCITQLLECLFDWTNNFDERVQTDIVYLDFAKAFDTVPHNRLIHKLQQAGIRGKLLYWIRGFLSGRKQRVILRNGRSNWLNVTSGVPQGSILGPLLFILYVNDIPDSISTTVKMFADDTKIYQHVKEAKDCEKLQQDLNALSAWSMSWLLNFNASKCVVVSIRNNIPYNYTLNEVCLEHVEQQKDLGILISNDLNPRRHIAEITKKSYQRLGLIKRCFTDVSTHVERLYKSLIRPLLEYGSPVWNPHYQKDIETLDKVQRKCVSLSNSNTILESLSYRRKFVDMCEVYKMMNNLYKNSYTHFFTMPARSLRGHSMKLAKERTNSEVARNFFTRRVVDAWNKLPQEVIDAPTLSVFKKRLRSLPTGQEG